MPKVYLSPAYHYWNPCAVAGCDETTHNNLYLDVLEPYLAACGIQYKRGPRRTPKSGEDGDALMLQAVRESDAWGADVHYVSHTNAANGGVRGYRPMIYPGSGGGRKLAACILKYRRKIYDQPIRLSESSVWYELRAPAAVSFYEEHQRRRRPVVPQPYGRHCRGYLPGTVRVFRYPVPGAGDGQAVSCADHQEGGTGDRGAAYAEARHGGRRRPERHAADEGQGVLPLRHPRQ